MELRFTNGVPLMVPLLVLNVSPLGKEGCISQLSMTAPPLLLKVMAVITESLVATVLLCEATILAAGSLMVMVIVTESEPPELLAHIL